MNPALTHYFHASKFPICNDAGEQAVAKKVEFAAKIIIAVLALPILVAILESLLELMPG